MKGGGRRTRWHGWKIVYYQINSNCISIQDVKYYLDGEGFDEEHLGFATEDTIEVSPQIYEKILGTYTIKGDTVTLSDIPFSPSPPPNVKKRFNEQIIKWKFAPNQSFWNALTMDVQVYTLGFLNSKQLAYGLQVSKSWYKLCSTPELWENLCNKEYPKIPNSENVQNWKDEFCTKATIFKIEQQKFTKMHMARMAQRHWMMCGVHMFHPVNGRRGFDLLPPPPNAHKKPPLEIMIRMLRREEELRLSKEIQAEFSNPQLDTIHVAHEVQKRVVREFGYEESMEETLGMIRAAPALYPQCPEVRKIPHYQKFNRACEGNLQLGDFVPNAILSTLNGNLMTLFDYVDALGKTNQPLVVAAGSYT